MSNYPSGVTGSEIAIAGEPVRDAALRRIEALPADFDDFFIEGLLDDLDSVTIIDTIVGQEDDLLLIDWLREKAEET